MGKPFGPSDLSPLKSLMTSNISISSKGLSNQLSLSPDIVGNSNTSGKGLSTCCSEYKSMKDLSNTICNHILVKLSFFLIKYLVLRTPYDWMYALGSVHSMYFIEFINLLNLLYF